MPPSVGSAWIAAADRFAQKSDRPPAAPVALADLSCCADRLDRCGHALLGPENSGPGDQDVSACLDHGPRRGRADTSVCLEVAVQTALVEHLSQARDLGQRGFDELLAAETRIHC